MKHTTERMTPQKEAGRQLRMLLLIFLAVTFVGVLAFLKFYGSYIDNILYAERLSQMREVTTQLFSGLEDVVDSQWTTAEVQRNFLQHEQPATSEELLSFLDRQAGLNDFGSSSVELMVVDDGGRYYTQNGMQGMLVGRKYLLDEPERVSYVYNALTTGWSEMIFLLRLEQPISMQLGDRETTLTYCGLSRSMSELEPYFSCAAYNGNNSVYVLDNDGIKLFSSEGNDLLRGTNLYNVLGKMDYLHDSSLEDAKRELSEHQIAYSNAVLDGEEYYYSLYQMEHAEWTLLFLVPSVYVATNTVSLINTTMRLILIFALILLCVCAILIYVVLRIKQKQAINAERRNSDALAVINQELDRKNTELSRAVETAEAATRTAEAATARAEAAMREAEAASKAKSDFLSNMSHDIRTPMNAIVGITNLMEHEGNTSDRLRGYIQKIKFSSRHLLSLINDILDMSKIESNEVELSSEKVSLAEQVGQVDSIIRSQTNERGQSFTIRVHEIAHEYLIGDGVRLRQIFLNLLSNAVKYTPTSGRILFDIAELPCEKDGYASFRFSVTDTGYGMTPEFVEHIFEPFTRAENSVTNKVQGTGLGMAITKNIVDLMGGTIDIQSEVGKGSCFTVELMMQIDRDVRYELDTESVLLISHEEFLTRNVRAPLEEFNFPFATVTTPEEAVAFLRKTPVDVVLLGGHLRNKDLAKTVQSLRAVAPKAELIFCVDYAQRDQVQETISQCGVDGLIPRPFFLSNLEIAIGRVRANAAPESEGMSVLSGMRFLCAEDNALNAEILEAILEMYGASCTICPDGEELVKAFELVKPGEYDAILMDIQMPHMNGYEATKAIRGGKNPLGKTIPIIAMTANAFSDDVQNSIAAGMDAHISKPIDVAILEKTMRGFLTPPPESAIRGRTFTRNVHKWVTSP